MVNSKDNPELFFARQVINNACGTQALLSVLLNIKDERVKLGETLQNFIDFTQCLDAEMTGNSQNFVKICPNFYIYNLYRGPYKHHLETIGDFYEAPISTTFKIDNSMYLFWKILEKRCIFLFFFSKKS